MAVLHNVAIASIRYIDPNPVFVPYHIETKEPEQDKIFVMVLFCSDLLRTLICYIDNKLKHVHILKLNKK